MIRSKYIKIEILSLKNKLFSDIHYIYIFHLYLYIYI